MCAKPKPFRASDARRMGGQPLDLRVGRAWLDYAVWISTGDAADALYAARREPGDTLTVRLSERDTRALAAACEAVGRTRTAGELRAALVIALEPPKPFDAMEHLESLAAEGELDAEELAMLRGVMAKRDEAGKELF